MSLHWIHTATILSIFLSTSFTQAQTVEILAADSILRDPAVTEAQRLIGHVKLGHEDAVLTCDSAWRFDDGSVEVFSHVVMQQPPATTMTADYLRIEPNEEWALASGDVELLHESAKLSAPSLMYLMKSRAARYSEVFRMEFFWKQGMFLGEDCQESGGLFQGLRNMIPEGQSAPFFKANSNEGFEGRFFGRFVNHERISQGQKCFGRRHQLRNVISSPKLNDNRNLP